MDESIIKSYEMEERILNQNIDNMKDGILYVYHNYGFFSNCCIRLLNIVTYHNRKKTAPLKIDNSRSFFWYKQKGKEFDDVFYDFFKENVDQEIYINKQVHFHHSWQFLVYHDIPNIDELIPYVKRYFSPTDEILDLVDIMTEKYKIDYDNTCVLFYRGNDKAGETDPGDYNEFVIRAYKLYKKNKNLRFLVQSDETDFIELCQECLPEHVVFENEIRHIRRNKRTTVDMQNFDNYKYAKYFLAIMIIMSKCKHVICNSGNISLWIYFFRYIRNRKNISNFQQYLKNKWY